MRHAMLRVFDDSSVSIFFFHGEQWHCLPSYKLLRVPNVQVLDSQAYRFRRTERKKLERNKNKHRANDTKKEEKKKRSIHISMYRKYSMKNKTNTRRK